MPHTSSSSPLRSEVLKSSNAVAGRSIDVLWPHAIDQVQRPGSNLSPCHTLTCEDHDGVVTEERGGDDGTDLCRRA